MENKYYTPDIEDIRVGYECEINGYDFLFDRGFQIDQEKNKGIWGKGDLDSKTIEFLFKGRNYNKTRIRTPYLTKEQIEAEGWQKTDESQIGQSYKKDWNKCIFFKLKEDDNSLKHMCHFYISNRDESIVSTIYLGECKSINEFRTICKLLNLK